MARRYLLIQLLVCVPEVMALIRTLALVHTIRSTVPSMAGIRRAVVPHKGPHG